MSSFSFFLEDLRQVVEEEKNRTGEDENSLFENKSGRECTNYDMFISYSYRDDKIIPLALYLLLKKSGCNPYLPKFFSRKKGRNPTKTDIEITKFALLASRSLVLANGPETTRSQWIPWEIGFMAGKTGKVCVFDAEHPENAPKNSEFLNLYPKLNSQKSRLLVGNNLQIMDWINEVP